MNITKAQDEDILVLKVEGKLDTGTAPEAQDRLQEVIRGGARKIIVDFESLDYISSAGLRVLLATAKELQKSGGSLHFCNLNETVTKVFEMSGFDTIFEIFESKDAAAESF